MRSLLIILFMTVGFTILAQSETEVYYYKDFYQREEVKKKKAKFKKVVRTSKDTIRLSFFDLKNDQLRYNQIRVDSKPVGIWESYDEKGNLSSQRNFDSVVYGGDSFKGHTPDNPDYEEPSFKIGGKTLMEFIQQNVEYPSEAVDEGIQGTVYVRVVIDADGNNIGVSIMKSVHPFLDFEASRVAKTMKKWGPAKMNGKTVKSEFTFPISFRLA